MYEFHSRLRYSEIDGNRRMTPTAMLTRMQDCCVFQYESIGRGPAVWMEEQCVWIIISWQVQIHTLPEFGSIVTTKTIPYRFHGFEGDRNFVITARKEDGGEESLCAVANSRWVYYDMKRTRPVRVPRIELERCLLDEPYDMDYAPRRIALPEAEFEKKAPVPVTKMNIDTNGHVNNIQYVEMAVNLLPEDFVTEELRVEYVRQTLFGDTLFPEVCHTGNVIDVVLKNGEGQVSSIVEFHGAK